MKRTNIVLDEELIEQGKRATGLKTSKAVVDFALNEIVRRHNLRRILSLKGKVKWHGDIEKMRLLRSET
jgi:Arc/MetJ family transcription regulator